MRCKKCGLKKDTDLLNAPWKCPQCGEKGGDKYDVHEVPAEDITQLQKIKSFLETLPNKSISLKELEQQIQSGGEDNKKSTNYLPWILGGIGIILVVGIIIYFLLKDKKSSKE